MTCAAPPDHDSKDCVGKVMLKVDSFAPRSQAPVQSSHEGVDTGSDWTIDTHGYCAEGDRAVSPYSKIIKDWERGFIYGDKSQHIILCPGYIVPLLSEVR